MEKLSRKLACNIASSLGYDAEQEAVVAYGLIALIQIIITTLLVLILGLLVGAPIEALIVCFSVSILRKYSGGAHVGSVELCTATSVVYCTLAAFLSRRVLLAAYSPVLMLAALAAMYVISFLTVYRRAPVDSPNKPIRTEAKRKRMRRGSFLVLSAYIALSAVLFAAGFQIGACNAYGIALLFGVTWQMLTLTSAGALITHNLDKLFLKEVKKV